MDTVLHELRHVASDSRFFPHGCTHGWRENDWAFHVEVERRDQTVRQAERATGDDVRGGRGYDKESASCRQFDVRTERKARIEGADYRRSIT